MGVVWAAEQLSPRRRVALKVVRSGRLVDDEEIKMFKREADALARLEHPNIAAIYESGLTDDGQHFFAMELVSGKTLNHYLAGRQKRSTAEIRHRLRLLRDLCLAVHYAHQRGVIHRDLKPSNVIVAEPESPESSDPSQAYPQVKILDFGLARITDSDTEMASMVTEVGVIKGTLPYMSPEQATGNPQAIDTRTDVYALGVMMYEMIAGQRPYKVASSAIAEALRVISEEQPKPLREVLSGTLRIDRDLETIAAKALEKDPDRRYDSAAALAEDIDRFLTSQPILARPPSAAYQLHKLIQRHRVSATLVLVSLLAIIGFGLGMSLLYRQSQANLARAVTAEELASQEAETANQVAAFLENLFRESNPRTSSGQDLTARQMLEAGADRVEEELKDFPVVQARLMQIMGQAFRDIGQYDDGTRLLEQALAQAREAPAMPPDRLTGIRDDLVYHYTLSGNYGAAIPLLEEALQTARQTLPPGDPEIARTINALSFGELRSGNHTDASVDRQREAVAIQGAAFPEPNHDLSMYLMNLGWLLRMRNAPQESTRHLEESLSIHRQVHVETRPSEAWILQHLGWARIGEQSYEAAAGAFQGAIDVNRQLFGEVHPELAFNIEGLAMSQFYQGKTEEAIATQREAIEMQRQATGEEHVEMASRRNTLVYLLADQRRFDEAAAVLDEAISLVLRTQGEQSPDLIVLWGNRSEMHWNRGRADEALPEAQKAWALIQARDNGVTPVRRAWVGLLLGKMLVRSNRFSEAEPILRGSIDISNEHSIPPNLVGLGEHFLAEGLVQAGRYDEAVELANISLEKITAAMGEDHWHRGYAFSSLASAQSGLGDFDEAEVNFSRSRTLFEAQPQGDIERVFDAERYLQHARATRSSARIATAMDRLAAERNALPQ